MRSAVVLMTGFALLIAGILVLALTGATLPGIALLVVGLLTKIGGVLLGDPAGRSVGPAAARTPTRRAIGRGGERTRAGGGSARGVTVRVRPTSAASEHDRRRAS